MTTPPTPQPTGQIVAVEPGSAADTLGVRPGDGLLSVNGQPCQDVIDVQFYAAEDWLDLTLQRGDATITCSGPREEGQPLGLEFAHPTFDIDIRRCNNLCTFCFVLQMAPRMRRTLYIKDDDYRYSFLYGHFVTLTNLSAHDWERIKAQRLSPLYVSVHDTDLERRRAYLRNADAPDVLVQLRELGEHGIECHTQIVVTPGVNDGAHLEQSVRDLAALYPAVLSVSVVPVGLTSHHKYGLRVNRREEAARVLDTVEAWQAEFLESLGVRFVYPTDEWYLVTGRDVPPLEIYEDLDALEENGLGLVRTFLDEWAVVRQEEVPALKPLYTHLTLVTAPLFAEKLSEAAAELSAASGVRLDVLPVTNTRLGETITCAGLMMGQDVLDRLAGQALGEVVVLPRVMFDHPDGISLDDISPGQIAQQV
ncbi:MAG: DUF512 domain-containing protein, partial [Anaerolineae bacterium]|nr:DUF512 domain-containing protein [Anaerolineae bacterium]